MNNSEDYFQELFDINKQLSSFVWNDVSLPEKRQILGKLASLKTRVNFIKAMFNIMVSNKTSEFIETKLQAYKESKTTATEIKMHENNFVKEEANALYFAERISSSIHTHCENLKAAVWSESQELKDLPGIT